MDPLVKSLLDAQQHAFSIKPQKGGFPVLAKVLHEAGVLKNTWHLPACQSIYSMKEGRVVMQGTPLFTGSERVPAFNQEALVTALRTDQNGESAFPEFLSSAWRAGIISYEVDFVARKVTYFGALGEEYVEEYPDVAL